MGGATEKGMRGWGVAGKVGTGEVATRATHLAHNSLPQGCRWGTRLASGPGLGRSFGQAGCGPGATLRPKSPASGGSQCQ
jgi:hypothetical protein